MLGALGGTRGHFGYESGHHGDLWLGLDGALTDAGRLVVWAETLAARARSLEAEVVCGPLTGGAFLAQNVAAALGVHFVYTTRRVDGAGRVEYTLPRAFRPLVGGSPLLVVDDVINAGSALRATLGALQDAGGSVVGIGALATLGEAAGDVAAALGVPLVVLDRMSRRMWSPGDCPLCRDGVPLEEPWRENLER